MYHVLVKKILYYTDFTCVQYRRGSHKIKKAKKSKSLESYNVIRFRKHKSEKFLLKSWSDAGYANLCCYKLWGQLHWTSARRSSVMLLGQARRCYRLTADLGVLWWQAVADRWHSSVTGHSMPGGRADTALTVSGRWLAARRATPWWRLWRGPSQWRRQDLLRGGAKMEIRSWGTHSGPQGRVQQLLDD